MIGTELASTAWHDRYQKAVSEGTGTTPHGRDIFDGTDHRIDHETASPTDGVPSSAHRRLRRRGAGQ